MILYVNGDSNATGSSGQHWVEKLQKRYQFDLVNHAQGGGSNPRVLRTTQDYFVGNNNLNRSDVFVIIGWTSWEREEWWFENQWVQVNASTSHTVPFGLSDRFKQWVSDSGSISQINKSRTLHQKIYDLHRWFKKSDIPHLFFNALMPFQHETLNDIAARLDWGVNYLGPYDNDSSYFWFLKQKGYQCDRAYHYGPEAQNCWADFLIEYIDSHNLLK